jgi:hypothetical protein
MPPFDQEHLMLANAVLFSFISFVALVVLLLGRLKFLTPIKSYVFHTYGHEIGIFALVLFFNLFAAFYTMFRRFRLKNTGQKLLHLDKQVKTGHSALSREIAERYGE